LSSRTGYNSLLLPISIPSLHYGLISIWTIFDLSLYCSVKRQKTYYEKGYLRQERFMKQT